MKKKLFGFAIIFYFLFCQSSYLFSFTLIYKSGKKLEGTWVSEDQYTIRVRDKQGVVHVVRKSLLDLKAMVTSSRLPNHSSEQPALSQTQPVHLKADIRSQNPYPSVRPLPITPEKLAPQKEPQAEKALAQNISPGGPASQLPPPKLPDTNIKVPRGGRNWSPYVNLSSAYDSNIDHDEDPTQSVGVVYGAGVRYRNNPKDPALMLNYEIANHHYTETDKWDRISQTFIAVYSRHLTKKLTFQTLGEISFKGSSEDREIGNNYILRPMLLYRIFEHSSIGIFAAQRFKRFPDENSDRNANNRFGGIVIEQEFGKHEIEVRYRYEKNDSEGPRNQFVRSTYEIEYEMPLFGKSSASFQVKIKPQRFFNRFAEIDVDDAPDIEVPRRDTKYSAKVEFAVPLGKHLQLLPSYEYETRTSNDEEEFYTAHLPTIAFRYLW